MQSCCSRRDKGVHQDREHAALDAAGAGGGGGRGSRGLRPGPLPLPTELDLNSPEGAALAQLVSPWTSCLPLV